MEHPEDSRLTSIKVSLSKSSPFDCLESKEMKLDPDRNCCQVLIIEDNSYVQSVRRIKSLSHSTNVNNLA